MKWSKKSWSTNGCRIISMYLLWLNYDGTVKNDNMAKLSHCTLNYKMLQAPSTRQLLNSFLNHKGPGERQPSIPCKIIPHQSERITSATEGENCPLDYVWPHTAWIMSNLYMLDMSFSRVTCFPKSPVKILIVTNVLSKEISFYVLLPQKWTCL